MRTLKLAVSVGLALASSAVLAQPTIPIVPPASGTPAPTTGNSGIIVSAYDLVRNVSIVEYTGLNLNDLLPNAVGGTATPAGGETLDFGTIAGWSTTFGASNVANIRFSVAGFDST